MKRISIKGQLFGRLNKVRSFYIFCSLAILLVTNQSIFGQQKSIQPQGRWIIHSNKPAVVWGDALLTGNGKQGTMVRGNTNIERITFVHEELFLPSWPRDKDLSVNTSKVLPEVRKLIKQQKYRDASQLSFDLASSQQELLGVKKNNVLWGPSPHPAFDLVIDGNKTETPSKYARYLNLETGVATIQWSDSKGEFEQNVFTSRTNNVNVIQLRAFGESKLNLTLSLAETPGRIGEYYGQDLEKALETATYSDKNQLYFHAAYARDPGGYDGIARVTLKGGSLVHNNNSLQVKNAKEVLILVKTVPIKNALNSVREKVWEELNSYSKVYNKLLEPHAVEHGKQFQTVTLDLGQQENWGIATEKMLAEAKAKGATPLFVEQVHAMGRYLFISSSGRFPPPLQGIWGASWNPSWAGGFVYDSNINLAISAGSMGNMHESMESYFSFIERQLPAWRRNAKKYLNCRGFLVGHYTDPESGSLHHFNRKFQWMYWPGGGGWNIRPFYDHYLLTGDRDFLEKRVFPLYREMADFYEDYLVRGEDGLFAITPGISPENTPGNSTELLSFNTTFDVAVAREVFQVLINSAKELGIEKNKIDKWQEVRDKLPPYLINGDGALKEWATPLLEDHYNHRHSSHLYPIYPGLEFFEKESPEYLFDAAKVALEKRFQIKTNSAHGLIHVGLMSARIKNVERLKGSIDRFAQNGFLYTSLASSHFPKGACFNLDGVFSFPSLIMESLIFSLPGEIEIMPAWPLNSYPSGSIKGVLARGGFKLDLSWDKSALSLLTVYSENGGSCLIRYNEKVIKLQMKADESVSLGANLQLLE